MGWFSSACIVVICGKSARSLQAPSQSLCQAQCRAFPKCICILRSLTVTWASVNTWCTIHKRLLHDWTGGWRLDRRLLSDWAEWICDTVQIRWRGVWHIYPVCGHPTRSYTFHPWMASLFAFTCLICQSDTGVLQLWVLLSLYLTYIISAPLC